MNVTVSPTAIQIIAASIDIIAPQGSSIIITLSGFSFDAGVLDRAAAYITVVPSLVGLFQYDGKPIAGVNGTSVSLLVTDLQRRVRAVIASDAGGIPFDFLGFVGFL